MNIFENLKQNRVGKNLFDLSHERKLSTNYGNLTPILVQEVIPGDTFSISTEQLIRLAPLVAPAMQRIDASIHFFFVPNRLLWSEWEDFITGGRLGTSEPVHPTIKLTSVVQANHLLSTGSLADHLGITPSTSAAPMADWSISALPFRAYQKIFDEYYRDQNLSPSIWEACGGDDSGEVSIGEANNLMELRKRCWRKDYFTSALPWAQRGGSALIPLDAEINYLNNPIIYAEGGGTGALSRNADNSMRVGGGGTARITEIQNIESIENATVTVNDLRKAVRLQEWLEKTARAGARYIEQILSHFGVRSSDARLQRPEYLGGGRTPIIISEVLNQTASNVEGEPALGTMGGHGITAGQTVGFKKSFEEHGIVMGILSIMPQATYQDGLDRMYRRFDKYDYYWPEFAHLGEQPVQSYELFFDGTTTSGSVETAFGYQSRYAEYKYKQSTVHGDFRDSLAYWHEGRKFTAPPALNDLFVKCEPANRIFAYQGTDSDHFLVQLYTHFKAIRPIPYFNIPTL